MRRWLLPPAAAALGGALLWGAGLAWFLADIARPPPPLPRVEGILALTGGADRIETALRLLADSPDAALLISGVGGGIDFETLARRAGVDPLPLAARAEIGRGAASTRGNAAEARAWIAARGLRTVAVVTAYYHMPRALAELSRAVPGVAWAPYPVPNPPRGAPLRAVAGEYTKYLAAASGLSAWLPAREAAKGGNG